MPISPKIRELYQEERDAAYERAREQLAGTEINPDNFKVHTPSKYPAKLVGLVVVLCVLVFVAAFVPSAYRLFAGGSREFCQTLAGSTAAVESDPRCQNVGYATVVLAETGSIVFILALAVVGRSSPVSLGKLRFDLTTVTLWAGALVSTSIAIAGNAHISEPWKYGGYIFDYLITFAPPLLVLGVGYVLKEMMLHAVANRHAYTVALNDARRQRQERLLHPDRDPAWMRVYSLALRDALRRANNRYKPELADLNGQEWKYLIAKEMLQSRVTVDDNYLQLMETVADREEEQERKQLPANIPGAVAGTPEVWPNGDGTWHARATEYDKERGGFRTERDAQKWLKQYRYHRQRREGMK